MIVFIAFGTRGDVQPLACLASHVKNKSGDQVAFITHLDHRTWIEEPPFECLGPVYIDSASSGPAAQTRSEDEHAQHVACWDKIRVLWQSHSKTLLIVFNLFALEGFHIAEALNVPCVAASPCQVPYSCPGGFKRRFVSAYGIRLHRLLSEAEADGVMQSGTASRAIDADIGTGPMPEFGNSDAGEQPGSGLLSWKDISLWMWPLFTERWRRFRTEVLALAPCPLHDRHMHAPLDSLPPPVPLLYGFSDLIVPQPGYHPKSVTVTSFWLPDLSRLNMSLPEDILDFMGKAAKIRLSEPPTKSDGAPHLYEAHDGGGNVVCFDIGSSGRLGLIRDPVLMLQVFANALKVINRHAIVLTSGWPPMHEAHVSLPSDLRARLLLHPRPVPHQILLPACALLVHPGGAGTVAAALVSGCPQLLFPLHYDQAFWAERLTYLGLSPQPLDAAVLFNPAHRQASGETAEISPLSEGPVGPLSDMDQGPSSGRTRPLFDSSDESNGRARLLADRLSECLSSGIKKICQQMAKDLVAERAGGLSKASDIILGLKHISLEKTLSLQPLLRLMQHITDGAEAHAKALEVGTQ